MSNIEIPASKQWWPVEPFAKQQAALALCGVEELFYGGAAGGGKSEYFLMSASQFADHPDSHALILRKTYQDLARPDALLDRAKQWWEHREDVRYSQQEKKFTFPSGATISFGHLENSTAHYQYQGGAYTYIGIDESTQIPDFQITFLGTRLRKASDCPVPLQLRLASNPGNISHEWHKRRYVDSPNTRERVFVPAFLHDNPHMNDEEYQKRFEALSPVERAQLLDGDWSAAATTQFFDLGAVKWVDAIPDVAWRWVRSWDFAATRPKPGTDPDWTAGAKVGFHDGQYCVAGMERCRDEPPAVDALVLRTAEQDGTLVDVVGEEEGGSSGKSMTNRRSRDLAGYNYSGIRPTGDKASRARSIASAMRNGNVYVVRGSWVDAFVEELRAFPTDGVHDDQVDALSQADVYLTGVPQPYIY